jgi:ABC-type transporter Mla subunit MlaD
MKENRSNAIIAISTVIAALIMVAALSFAIGKWSFGNQRYTITILFPNATGINANSAVRYAGADVGRVKNVRLLARKDQTLDPITKTFNAIEVIAEIDKGIEVGDDVQVCVKQDGIGIAAKYVLLTPGPNRDSKDLADGSTVQGRMPFDLSDLIQPAGEMLTQTKAILAQLQPIMDQMGPIMEKVQPVMTRLDGLTATMQTSLPPLMTHADKFLLDGDDVLANLNTPESRDRINNMLASLRVTSENLKVVTSNAKALTATLAEKPWRVFWGGSTVTPPPESDVLKSSKVIPLTPAAPPPSMPPKAKTNTAAPAQKNASVSTGTSTTTQIN